MQITIVQFDRSVIAGTYGQWLSDWGVRCRTLTPDTPDVESQLDAAAALLLLGGHMGVADRAQHPLLDLCHRRLPDLVAAGRPILAICLGGQLLADALGGRAIAATRGERGVSSIRLTAAGMADPLFAAVPNPFVSFQWHKDSFDLPPDGRHLACTDLCPGQAFRQQNAYGLQFHPEVNAEIVAGWCRRAGTGEAPLQAFRTAEADYRPAAERLLRNFVETFLRTEG